MAYGGDEDIVCVYIDIKTALNKLPLAYREGLIRGLIYDNKDVDAETISNGLDFMEDILNGR